MQLVSISSKGLPRKGTRKTATPTPITTSVSTKPRAKKASILPSTSSAGRRGVDSSCSMVPISHSRAMVSEVSIAAMMLMITAIRPGTM